MRFGDEYQIFRSELQIALNSNDNYDYVNDLAHPIKISTWSAATLENPSASLTGKPALHHMGDLSGTSVVQKNNGVNAHDNLRLSIKADNEGKQLSSGQNLVAYTNTVDKEGNPVITAIRINNNAFLDGVRVDSNDIGSIYGKSDNFYIFLEKQIDQNRILYINKDQLEKVPGVQFPDKLLNIDPKSNLALYREVVNRKNSSASQALQDYQEIKNSIPHVKRFSLDVPVQQTKDLIAVLAPG